ncbi:hypothetical protein ACE0DR_09600 [Azotobacter sp. CWF10]
MRGFLRQLREAVDFSMQITTGNLAATSLASTSSEIGKLMDMLIIMRKSLSISSPMSIGAWGGSAGDPVDRQGQR